MKRWISTALFWCAVVWMILAHTVMFLIEYLGARDQMWAVCSPSDSLLLLALTGAGIALFVVSMVLSADLRRALIFGGLWALGQISLGGCVLAKFAY